MAAAITIIHILLCAVAIKLFQLICMFPAAHQQQKLCCMGCCSCNIILDINYLSITIHINDIITLISYNLIITMFLPLLKKYKYNRNYKSIYKTHRLKPIRLHNNKYLYKNRIYRTKVKSIRVTALLFNNYFTLIYLWSAWNFINTLLTSEVLSFYFNYNPIIYPIKYSLITHILSRCCYLWYNSNILQIKYYYYILIKINNFTCIK